MDISLRACPQTSQTLCVVFSSSKSQAKVLTVGDLKKSERKAVAPGKE